MPPTSVREGGLTLKSPSDFTDSSLRVASRGFAATANARCLPRPARQKAFLLPNEQELDIRL
ncbi:hypothetical protein BDW68DRAFT_170395 [Aspergillus falconensis]